MADAGNRASRGKFLVVAYANFGGPHHGSAQIGEYDSLAAARAAASEQADAAGTVVAMIYDDQGNER